MFDSDKRERTGDWTENPRIKKRIEVKNDIIFYQKSHNYPKKNYLSQVQLSKVNFVCLRFTTNNFQSRQQRIVQSHENTFDLM